MGRCPSRKRYREEGRENEYRGLQLTRSFGKKPQDVSSGQKDEADSGDQQKGVQRILLEKGRATFGATTLDIGLSRVGYWAAVSSPCMVIQLTKASNQPVLVVSFGYMPKPCPPCS